MSKSVLLMIYLVESGMADITLLYDAIDIIIVVKLPNTAHRKSEWWSNNDKTHSQSSSWSDVGYKTTGIRLGESITFKKI